MLVLSLSDCDSWPSFLSASAFSALTPNSDLTVLIEDDQKSFHVHKVVVSRACKYYAKHEDYDKIKLKGVQTKAFKVILDLIYTTKAQVHNQDDLLKVRQLAEKLQIRCKIESEGFDECEECGEKFTCELEMTSHVCNVDDITITNAVINMNVVRKEHQENVKAIEKVVSTPPEDEVRKSKRAKLSTRHTKYQEEITH